ncbi:DNA-directed RNA polymerase, mitochondrial isoform X2 [Rhinolophus ferrumequinum]|uniref:DNA-directed RNA polymerase, mitochondrial n=1 Tax=Rhinolophus ferrumequinum TaxID=59479 RepID=A0A671FML8_RHIFE|nr:DNA-directed RNA polymerase, mitochondrial isoform X2 [Rhinolophus ferrumequinum]
MSALRWGRGAAGLRWALWPAGCPCLLAEEGAPLRGIWGRRRSSASPCEQDRRKDWGHAELLEVLEARARQLRADHVSEVTEKRVDVARLPEAGSSQPPRKAQAGVEAALELSGRWARKLDKEKRVMQKRKQQLEVKLRQRAEQRARKQQLHVEPRLQSRQLAARLQQWLLHSPGSPWAEQLTWLLREAPRRPRGEERRPADGTAGARCDGQRQRLLAFLQGCVLVDQPALAHHVLVVQHGRARQQRGLTLPMYNAVLHGWARKGSFKELVYVFFMLKDAGFSPDLLSYAAALQCMGRLDQNASTIQRCLKQMAQDGLQLQELFTSVALCKEDQVALLSAVRKAEPTFSPPQPPLPSSQVNTSPLLRDIYDKDQPASYPRQHLPLKMLKSLFQEQLSVEMATTVTVASVEKAPSLTKEVLQARKTLQGLRIRWEADLCQVLRETKANEAHAAREGRPSLFPYLCLLSEGEFAGLLLQTLQALPPQGESLLSLAQQLGLRIFNRHVVQRKQLGDEVRALERRYFEYLRLLASDSRVVVSRLPRQHWEALGAPEVPHEQPWPLPVVVQLGKQLAEVLVQTVKMPGRLAERQDSCKLIPVLYHVYSFRSFRQIGILKPHPAFMQLLATAAERTMTFEAAEVPMLCPPLPWTSPHSGAFLLSPTKLMRSMEGTTQHQRLLEACPPTQLHGALDALTQLGNCAWRVNGRVLDLVLKLFTEKGCPRLGVPAPPSEAPRPPQSRLPRGASPEHKAELRRELARCLKVAREMHSLRTDALYRLSLAQHLRHRVFWLPHNMDFRGRTYPCPPHFNHLGSDLARSLLEFAQGRPLGPHGLDWLKVHLVNLTGLKKRESLQARLAFADEVMKDILDSADRPLMGRKWWMEADEPWQALACCMEIAQAVRAGDPATHVSHFPVHQVEVFRRQDAERGVQVAQVLEGFISRKVVKQTVMTVVYGVTRYGGRLQIEKRLRELSDFPQEFVWEASHYLVRQVFNSLQEMFSGTRAIQHWLAESARLIARTGSAVEWVTPLGIPVIQPYHQDAKVLINGGIQSLTFSNSGDTSQKPNILKQKNGFPPNFIHSLDSSHMMLTALHCYRKGLTFVSVHDCFWTHAADVPVMNQVCREQFVRLHSQPILHDLSRFLVERFCSGPRVKKVRVARLLDMLLSVPKTGAFNLEQVKHSTYFFS